MKDEFVELDRHFAAIPAGLKLQDEDDIRRAVGLAATLRWEDLLSRHRVVILAEPGAGKTREIQNAAERLRSEKRTAFYLKLEHIAQDLEQAFDIGTLDEFEDWKRGSGEAWFFLDSVDEAKLADPRDFDKAVRRFASAISGHGQRAHLYLTSRLHEWRWETDAALVTSKFPFKPLSETAQGQQNGQEAGGGQSSGGTQKKENKENGDLLTVALAPLTGEQMLQFAKQRGVTDAAELIGEIARKDATLFASRPLDLQELIDYWALHKAIGSREELVRASIDAKLRERDSDRARLQPLTERKAREGARQLAAATTFQRKSRIVLPGSDSSRPGVLATALLPEWELAEVGTLLGRPLFDEPIYGTVRFHHRLIREYLTAEWLYELLVDGKSRRAVEGLLFTEQYGVEMVLPIARDVVPWLALKDDRIRVKCLEVAPDVLMEGGDPSRLPYEVRAGILKRFCAEQAGRTRGHRSFDAAAVQRFANDDLAADISNLIATYVLDQEVGEVLLTLVWQGRLRGCFADALRCATDTRLSNSVRITAIRAAVATCAPPDVEKTRDQILASIRKEDESLLAAVIAELGPARLPVDVLFSVVDRLAPPRRFSYRSLDSMMPRYVSECDVGMLRPFVEAALHRLREEPHLERRLFEVSQKNVWMLPYAGAACERLVQSRHEDALSDPVVAVISLMAAGEHHHDFRRNEHKFRELVPAWRELNYRLFWHDVAEARRELDEKRGERLTEFWQARIFREFTSFATDDFDTVVASVKSKDFLDDKLVALSLAFALYVNEKRPRKWREKLKRAVAGVQELKDALQKYLHPPAPSEDVKRYKKSERDFARRSKERKKQEEERAKKWRSWLKQNPHVLRDASLASKGSVWNATMHLLEAQRNTTKSESRWGKSNWQDLSSEFGSDVARAHRDGLVAYWRGFRPTLRSEGVENPNSIPNAIIVGLSGLEIEARETDGWAASLSDDEARLATRYALWEMNGFPDWLSALYKAHREAVRQIFLGEMQWEISAGHNANTGGYVISDLRPYGEWLTEDVAPDLLRMIDEAAPSSEQSTSDILSIVLAAKSVDESEIVAAAKKHAEQIQDAARQALWLAAWTGIDADSGMDALQAALGGKDPEAATVLAMRFAVALTGNRRGAAIGAKSSYKTPLRLRRLHQLLHAHIKRRDDIDRSGGGVYSPTLRDDAQEARDRVFGLLREIPGKETYLSLRAIAESYGDEPNTRMWIEHQARSKAESDADARTRAWTTDDVLTFNRERERKPGTHRELFELMRSRLEDLKRDMEHGDSSVAPILWRSGEETEHRVFVGRELRNQSLGRYAVPQEEELADAKRPDIRIHAVGIEGAVPIELKISDKWTGTELFERLINQLCGDYLRDDRSSCGIYLLTYRGVGRKSWDIPSGERVGFVRLIEELQKAADAHIAGISKIDSITVIGIDLTVRTSKSEITSE